MERLEVTRSRIWVPLLGALFIVVFVRLAVDAISPLLPRWETSDAAQEGQLTLFNNVRDGGNYGMPVEIGDWDGDGQYDLAVAAMAAPFDGDHPRRTAGEVYLYKGDGSSTGVIDRDDLSTPAIRLLGARTEDLLGTELFTGDIDGDGIEDLLLSSQNYDGPDGDRTNSGALYVVFGREDLFGESERTIDLLEGVPSDVLAIYGDQIGGRLGIWVETGDLDGDGFEDIIVGADQAGSDDRLDPAFHQGHVLVIYGRAEFPPVIDFATEDGASFPGVSRVIGRDAEDHFGASLHAADLNGDGQDELIVGAALERLSAGIGGTDDLWAHGSLVGGDGPADDERPQCGEVTIIFSDGSGERLPAEFSTADPPAEYEGRITMIYGAEFDEELGEEIASGDFNGDGRTDLALGAITGWQPKSLLYRVGRAYVVYNDGNLEGIEIDLLEADEKGVVTPDVRVSLMYGLERVDILGDTLSVGNFNGDAYDDLAVGIPHADLDGKADAGMVAILYGGPEPFPALFAPQADTLPPGLAAAAVIGAASYDLLSYSMEARDYDGDGFDDLFPNAMRADGADDEHLNAGDAYVISGYRLSGTELAIEAVSPPVGELGAPIEVRVLGSGFTANDDLRFFVDGEAHAADRVSSTELLVALPAALVEAELTFDVETRYGRVSAPSAFRYVDGFAFRRGDIDSDGILTITDPIRILNHLFGDGPGFTCWDAADADDDGEVNIADALYFLNYLFGPGAAPAEPFLELGLDPTPDELPCEG